MKSQITIFLFISNNIHLTDRCLASIAKQSVPLSMFNIIAIPLHRKTNINRIITKYTYLNINIKIIGKSKKYHDVINECIENIGENIFILNDSSAIDKFCIKEIDNCFKNIYPSPDAVCGKNIPAYESISPKDITTSVKKLIHGESYGNKSGFLSKSDKIYLNGIGVTKKCLTEIASFDNNLLKMNKDISKIIHHLNKKIYYTQNAIRYDFIYDKQFRLFNILKNSFLNGKNDNFIDAFSRKKQKYTLSFNSIFETVIALIKSILKNPPKKKDIEILRIFFYKLGYIIRLNKMIKSG